MPIQDSILEWKFVLTLGKFPGLGLEGWGGHVGWAFPLLEARVRCNLECRPCRLSSLLEMSQSQDKKGVLVPACLPALPPIAIPYMALVSLTGNMFLGMKFTFKQLFKWHSENVLFCFTGDSPFTSNFPLDTCS